jgi:hypothetical protein
VPAHRALAAVLAALLGIALPARAETWTPFFMGPEDMEVYVDRDAVHRSGDHVQVSAELWFGAGAQDMPLMDRGIYRIMASIDLSCRDQVVRALSRNYFDKAGVPVLMLDSPQLPERAEPGSFEEQLIKTYCPNQP